MTGEVSERIHDCISFVKGDWLIEGQEIQDDRVIRADSVSCDDMFCT